MSTSTPWKIVIVNPLLWVNQSFIRQFPRLVRGCYQSMLRCSRRLKFSLSVGEDSSGQWRTSETREWPRRRWDEARQAESTSLIADWTQDEAQLHRDRMWTQHGHCCPRILCVGHSSVLIALVIPTLSFKQFACSFGARNSDMTNREAVNCL